MARILLADAKSNVSWVFFSFLLQRRQRWLPEDAHAAHVFLFASPA